MQSPIEFKSSKIDEDSLERNEITISNHDLSKFENEDESSPLRINLNNETPHVNSLCSKITDKGVLDSQIKDIVDTLKN